MRRVKNSFLKIHPHLSLFSGSAQHSTAATCCRRQDGDTIVSDSSRCVCCRHRRYLCCDVTTSLSPRHKASTRKGITWAITQERLDAAPKNKTNTTVKPRITYNNVQDLVHASHQPRWVCAVHPSRRHAAPLLFATCQWRCCDSWQCSSTISGHQKRAAVCLLIPLHLHQFCNI